MKMPSDRAASSLFKSGLKRRCLFAVSILHAYWLPAACALGAVAAGTMFGDKSYLIGLSDKANELVRHDKPQDAIALLNDKISGYRTWRETNTKQAEKSDHALYMLYYSLAEAHIAADGPKQAIITAFRQGLACSDTPYQCDKIVAWIIANGTAEEANDALAQVCTRYGTKFPLRKLVSKFVCDGNVPAVTRSMEAIASVMKDYVPLAQDIKTYLPDDTARKLFVDACRHSPALSAFIFRNDVDLADSYVTQERFDQAYAAYNDLLKQAGDAGDRSMLEYKMCKCCFAAGQYADAIKEVDRVLSRRATLKRSSRAELLLLKGRGYIQLGQIDKACDLFLSTSLEYQDVIQAEEATFCIGYCHLLQGKFRKAKEAFEWVIKEYPQSSYANKAQLCLMRVDNMTNGK